MVGWDGSCRGGEGCVIQGLGGEDHTGVGQGGSCKGGVGWVM